MKFDDGWLDDEAVNLFVTLLNNYLSSVHAPAANLPSFFSLTSYFPKVIVPDEKRYDRDVSKAVHIKAKGEKECAAECQYWYEHESKGALLNLLAYYKQCQGILKRIAVPQNIRKNHWMMHCVDLETKTVSSYDSARWSNDEGMQLARMWIAKFFGLWDGEKSNKTLDFGTSDMVPQGFYG